MQARNAGTLTLLNREGKGKGIFGPTWGYQILRLRTSNAKILQTNITRGFCQFPDAVSARVDSTTASKFELIIMDAPIFHKVSEMLDEISCQKYSRGDLLYAINICFALNIHRARGAPPPQIVESSQQEFF
jgi:dissimilatory sulfite reductase (desulfoviridin) alpha/beta subunit